MAPTRTVGSVTVELMRSLGMTTVFGNPGSTELRFFKSWAREFRYVLGLHESSVVAMADGYAQITRNAAFVNLHSAAGVGHAMGSIYSAYRNQTPLVITAGQQTRAMFPTEPLLYAASAAELPRPYVKWAYEPARAQDVPVALARAYYTAMQKPCGPTFVSIPEDDWDAPAEPVEAREISWDFAPDPVALHRLARALGECRRPAIIVGPAVGQHGAFDLAVQLAERIKARVWASPVAARRSFPEDHPLFAGFLPPVRKTLRERLEGSDLILVLGAPVFTYHVHTEGDYIPAGAKLFLMTDDPAHIARAPVGVGICCTLNLGISQLLGEVGPAAREAPAGRDSAPSPPPASDPMTAAFALHTLSKIMPRDAIVVEEAPSHRNDSYRYLPIRMSEGFYTGAAGCLGWSLPAAVGIALAHRSRKVIAVLGDGSSLYNIQGLWTAVQHRLPVTFLILNNAGYGALKWFGATLGVPEAPGVDVPGVDFGSIARGFGCAAQRVDRAADLSPALRQAISSNEPYLLDIQVGGAVHEIH